MANEGEIITHSEFSYINTKGNTNTTSLAFEGTIKEEWEHHRLRLRGDAYRSTANSLVSKDKWSAEVNYDFPLCSRVSMNYLTGYKDDRFSGFNYQFYTGPGMGIKIINDTDYKLDLQGNLLYDVDKPNDLPSYHYLSSKLGAIYNWKIQNNLKFIQEATFRMNLKETQYNFFYSKTAFENKINSSLSMGVSYKIDYVNTPPELSFRSDRTFLVSLIVDY